jgi:exopolysaccharide production protein ExoZ
MKSYTSGREGGSLPRQHALKELVGVQYLRAFSVALVIFHHLTSETKFISLQLGGFGVEIFFVISGFIMWHTTVETNISVIDFWRHRIVRIVPLYWICLSILVAIAMLTPGTLNSSILTPENTFKSFLFVPHFHVVQKIIAPILIPGWSLDYEMYFYFLFGIALLVRSTFLRAALIAVVLLSLVTAGIVIQPKDAVAIVYTHPDLLKFLGGIILAILYRANLLNGIIPGIMLVLIGTSTHFIFVWINYGLFRDLVGFSSIIVVAGALALEPALRRSPNAFLHTIGNASYSIYLSHLYFIRLLELVWRHLLPVGSSDLLYAAYAGSAFAFAAVGGVLVYFGVERPMLNFLRKRPASLSPSPT